jgi:hypothetical protein
MSRFVKTVCYDADMNSISTFSAARRRGFALPVPRSRRSAGGTDGCTWAAVGAVGASLRLAVPQATRLPCSRRVWPEACAGPGGKRDARGTASRRLALRGGQIGENVTFRPEIARTHAASAGAQGATMSSRLRESVHFFPKVLRFDHLPAENRAYPFGKFRKSERAGSRSGGSCGSDPGCFRQAQDPSRRRGSLPRLRCTLRPW